MCVTFDLFVCSALDTISVVLVTSAMLIPVCHSLNGMLSSAYSHKLRLLQMCHFACSLVLINTFF